MPVPAPTRRSVARRAAALAATLLAAIAAPTAAQDFPNRPVRIVVPWAAGTPPDVAARAVASKLVDADRKLTRQAG